MAIQLGIPKETRTDETRVAATPDSAKKLIKKGLQVLVEKSAGLRAGFRDEDYVVAGAEIVNSERAFAAEIIYKMNRPDIREIGMMKKGAILIAMLEPYGPESGTLLPALASAGIQSFSMELIPRTSRAQSMDALSSQANIAGYRAVIEAAALYGRFLPLMMTSAGSAKPAKVIVLGAGVAGLQAIATAKRLGATVESYDVRPEVKEQIMSLGAKFIELDVGEEGSGTGGYAKELSEAGKAKQQHLLTERLKKADIIISTANIPGRKAPTLITEEAVKGMREGSVIIDMAAATGGNCPLTEAGKTVRKHGIVLVGVTSFPVLMPADSSSFYANNLVNLTSLMVDSSGALTINLEDDILAASLVIYNGEIRWKGNNR